MHKAQKSRSNGVVFYSIVWAAVYMLCLLIVKKFDPSQMMGVILSFIPTIAFILFIYNFIKKIDTMDEVERRIQLEATVWAFSLGLLLLMTIGLLELVVSLKKQDWGYISFIIPCFFAFYFIGIIISRRKYL